MLYYYIYKKSLSRVFLSTVWPGEGRVYSDIIIHYVPLGSGPHVKLENNISDILVILT